MNNAIKEQPITTVICKMSIDKNNTREQFRDAIRSVRDENNQTYIKDHFITITSNQTNYSIDHLKKDIRLINKNINKKLLSKYRLIKNKRHYKLSKDRIVFFCFFEQSKDKLLETTKHSCVLSNRSPSIVRKYSTKNMPKDNSENNDNFDVF
jgi:hypothetical protein